MKANPSNSNALLKDNEARSMIFIYPSMDQLQLMCNVSKFNAKVKIAYLWGKKKKKVI